jgi:LPS-assembly lipoprotein
MSWRRRVATLALSGGLGGLAIGLAGCGFQPLYGQNGVNSDQAAELAGIRVAQIGERNGQIMTNELHDSLNPNAIRVPATYELNVSIRESKADVAARADGTASRTSITITATWLLRRLSDSVVVVQGTAKALEGYDVLDSTAATTFIPKSSPSLINGYSDYGNSTSGFTGEKRAVHDCAEQIESRVASYIQSLHDPK